METQRFVDGSNISQKSHPFVLAAFAAEPFAAFLSRFRSHMQKVEMAMGGLLVLTGIMFLTGSITTMSFWLLETFPALGRIG